jgi:hypothetical protein
VSEHHIEMAAMLAISPSAGNLQLTFRDPQNDVYRLQVPAALLGGLIVALRSQAEHAQSGAGQPMTLDSGRPFTLMDGRVGLELTLDGAVRLPVLFPKEAIPVLRRTLEELDRLSRQSPARPRGH